MPTITTSSNTTPFRYPAATKMDRDSRNGHLWVQLTNTSGAFEFWRSTDNGNTWSLRTTITRSNVQETGSIYIDRRGNLHWTFRTYESGEDRLYYRRLTIDTNAWASELKVTSASAGSAGSVIYSGGDLVAVIAGSYIYIPIVWGERSGPDYHGLHINGVVVNRTTFAQSVNNGIIKGTRWWLHSRTGESLSSLSAHIRPSIDLEHYGDGTSADVPHIWVGFGCDILRCVKMSWSNGAWTAPSGTSLVSSGPFNLAGKSTCARWDGTRFMLIVPWAGDLTKVKLYQRKLSNTGGVTPEIISPAHPAGEVRWNSFGYYCAPNDDIYRVYAVGTSSDLLYYIEYERSSDTWTSWTTVSATAVQGVNNFGARRNIDGNLLFSVYMQLAGTAPYTLSHLSGTFPQAPTAPTWNSASGNSGEARNVSAGLLLDWDFHDPDTSDTQSAYALSRQIGAGTVQYFRASDSTWQTTEQKNVSGTTSRTLASGWGVDGDAAHVYKVKTWDSADTPGPYSTGFSVIPSALVNPTMNAPVEGSAITSPRLSVTWTVSEESAYRVVLKPNPNPDAVTTYDSGWVSDYLAVDHDVPVDLADGTAWTVTLQTRNNEGLESAVQTRNFTVDYVEPNAPTKTVAALPSSGVIRVVITNPASNVSHVGTGAAATANWAQVVPALPSGLQDGDLMLLLATTRNTTAGSVNVPSGWTALATGQNVRLMGRVRQTGDTAPTVTFAGGATGDDCIAQIAAFRNAALVASASAFLLNGSQQNITYPGLTVPKDGQLILLGGMKQDDWTSVATLAFCTEIGEPVSTLGNDAGLVWDFTVQTTASNIGQADLTVTGGVAAASRGMAVAIDTKPAATENDIYRRVVGDTGDGLRIATGVPAGGTHDDFTAVSGVNYEYKVRAWGTNGTYIDSAWS